MHKYFLAAAALLASCLSLNAALPSLGVVYGPWIQNTSETGFTVLWTTSESTTGWIEIAPDDGSAFYAKPRRKIWHTVSGRKMTGTFHCVKVDSLAPGTSYRYRLCGRKLIDDHNPYNIVFGNEATQKTVYTMHTLDSHADRCNFSMVCDMHMNDQKYSDLMSGMDKKNTDFILLDGDIVSFSAAADSVIKHSFGPLGRMAAEYPVMFAKGNHESRGPAWYTLPEIFPSSTGRFWYTFRQGPVAFVVLDPGEDKPDSDIEYFGTAAYDAYRAEELAWLKEAVKAPEFADAPMKVAVIHIPAFNGSEAWYTQRWIAENFTPVLNKAGVDLMLSGHHHRYILAPAGIYGNDFPIFANSNTERLDFKADSTGIRIDTYDKAGTITHSLEVPARKKRRR